MSALDGSGTRSASAWPRSPVGVVVARAGRCSAVVSFGDRHLHRRARPDRRAAGRRGRRGARRAVKGQVKSREALRRTRSWSRFVPRQGHRPRRPDDRGGQGGDPARHALPRGDPGRQRGRIDTIPLARTSVPFNLQDVLEKGTANLEKLDPELLARALTEASKTLTATQSARSARHSPASLGSPSRCSSRSDQTGELLGRRARSDQPAGGEQHRHRGADAAGQPRRRGDHPRREAIHTLLVETTTLTGNLAAVVDQTAARPGPGVQQLNGVLKTLRDEDATLEGRARQDRPDGALLRQRHRERAWGDLWLKDPALRPDDLSCRWGLLMRPGEAPILRLGVVLAHADRPVRLHACPRAAAITSPR